MYHIGSLQDLINVLEYSQREWGNDGRVNLVLGYKNGKGYRYGPGLYAGFKEDGTVIISNYNCAGEEG